jgi:hypothetical protein
MRMTIAATLFAAAATGLVAAVTPSVAFDATQQYPYCSINASNSGMSCYVASPDQCDRDHLCVPNPAFIGDARAQAALPAPKHRTRTSK